MSTPVTEPPAPEPPSEGGAAQALGVLAARVAGVDPAGLDDQARVAYLQDCHRLISAAEGARLGAVLALCEDSGEREHGPLTSHVECASAEVSLALTITPRSADRLVDHAHDLAERLPATLDALRAGRVDPVRVRIIAEESLPLLDAEALPGVETRALRLAQRLTPSRLRAHLRRMVIEADPQAARRRRDAQVAERRVGLWDEGETAAMGAFGLAPDRALAAYQNLDHLARGIRRAEAQVEGLSPRSLDQIRADVYLDLLRGRTPAHPTPAAEDTADQPTPAACPDTAGQTALPTAPGSRPPTTPATPGAGPGVQPVGRLHLTIPFATLIGEGQAPGEAAGYGPLLADAARTLAERALASGTTHCWTVTDGSASDTDGEFFAHGTGTYRPSPRMRAEILARDAACAFPTCTHPATRCDLDHTVPFDPRDPHAQAGGGPTCPCNLIPLCRRHHRLKQHTDWHVEHPRPGHLQWTTPTGTRHSTASATGTDPPGTTRPHPPPDPDTHPPPF